MREEKHMKLLKKLQAILLCAIFVFSVMAPMGVYAGENTEAAQAVQGETTEGETEKDGEDRKPRYLKRARKRCLPSM